MWPPRNESQARGRSLTSNPRPVGASGSCEDAVWIIRLSLMSDDQEQPAPAPSVSSVPKAVVSRLSLYLRELQHLLCDGHETTSSTRLGSLLGFTDAQVRKDLAYFGQFGYPGIGYRCQELMDAIKRILGTNRPWAVAMLGVGNLGQALLKYRGFAQQGFEIVAGFDVRAEAMGGKAGDIPVYPIEQLSRVVAEKEIRLAILAVPAAAAQQVANLATEAGISGILNFAPVTISHSSGVGIVGVDLAIELEQLTFAVVNSRRNS